MKSPSPSIPTWKRTVVPATKCWIQTLSVTNCIPPFTVNCVSA